MAQTHETGVTIKRSAILRYGAAAVAVAAATAVELALEPVLGKYSPYVPFTLAVIVASLVGGRGPGVAATALTLVSVPYFFLEPRYSLWVSEPHALPGLALFGVVGTIISFLIGRLRQKSARLEELNMALEMAHAMVRTPDGVITYWSRGAATMYGWPPEDAIGRRSQDLLKTEFPEPLEKIQERLMERGNWGGELRHHRRDGSMVVAASHWSLQRDQQGRPSAVVEVNNDITALRQAEEARGESEAQFRTLANAIPQLCWMANADGWVFWYNQRWYEYTGTTPEQMEGWGWQSVHDPEELPKVLERWKASLATGEPFDMTFPLRGADGVFRAFLTRVMPVNDSAGKVVRWFGTNTDISERKRAEEALLQKTELVNYSHDAIITADKNRVIMTWNRGAEEIYGWTEAEALGNVMHRLLHTGSPVSIADIDRELTRDGRWDGELIHTRRDGKQIVVESRQILRRDAAGVPLGILEINRDITERKRAEEALQQKTELVNYSHDAIMTADKNRVIMMWNRGAEEIYGWTEAEAIGKVMHQLLLTGSPVSIDDIDRKLTRDGRWDGELVHTRRDGKQIIVESRQILRRDSAGVPVGILEINRDISDRKRLEDQFRQAQKLEGIGRLAGGVAHDFNNLLTVISGYSQTVLDEIAVRHPLREPIEQISKAAARATGLTRQLLIFSRSQVTEPSNFVLNDLVRDFEKMLRRLIGEDIDLVLALDPGAGTIRADAGQIEQVILNLAVNARDAMPKGGTLSIETTSLLADEEFAQNHLSVQPGLYVVLVVSDTGVGMSPEVKSHLFEPFFTTKEAGKGTGLGLSTVYGIVKQSGGSIWVYSESGRGTTFRILFPAIEVEAGPTPGVPVEAPSGSETILVAEDEPDVRGFIRRILERRGYTVLEGSNGREALEVARKHTGPIHLVMADVVMPEMGGAEFADQFGAEHPGIPVLFMSGYTNHLGRRDEMGAGYLQKPFTSASLLTQVRAVLDAV